MDEKPRVKVLFLCTGNSCRSQMAEGWARHLLSDRVEAYSAGTRPQGLNRLAVAAMAEAGVDISGHESKHVDELIAEGIELVITVCDSAAGACPVFPGAAKTVHVPFADPPELAAAAGAADDEHAMPFYRTVRDEIRVFVEVLRAQLS